MNGWWFSAYCFLFFWKFAETKTFTNDRWTPQGLVELPSWTCTALGGVGVIEFAGTWTTMNSQLLQREHILVSTGIIAMLHLSAQSPQGTGFAQWKGLFSLFPNFQVPFHSLSSLSPFLEGSPRESQFYVWRLDFHMIASYSLVLCDNTTLSYKTTKPTTLDWWAVPSTAFSAFNEIDFIIDFCEIGLYDMARPVFFSLYTCRITHAHTYCIIHTHCNIPLRLLRYTPLCSTDV